MAHSREPMSKMMDSFNSDSFTISMMRMLKKTNIPGLSIAIVHKEANVSRTFGAYAFSSTILMIMARQMTPQTLFEIGSASISLTAAAVALLITDSRCPEVRYNAEMAELLPEQFVMPGNKHDGQTVEDILSYKTGMAP